MAGYRITRTWVCTTLLMWPAASPTWNVKWIVAAVLAASALVTGAAHATQVTIYATTPDGHIYGSDATYATARSTSDFEDASGTTFGVGQATGYTIYRGFLAFDTGAVLPAAATVTDVKLGMQGACGPLPHIANSIVSRYKGLA